MQKCFRFSITYLPATNTYCYMECFNVSLRDALESCFLDRQNIALTDPDTLEEFAMLSKNERLFVYGRFETKRKTAISKMTLHSLTCLGLRLLSSKNMIQDR